MAGGWTRLRTLLSVLHEGASIDPGAGYLLELWVIARTRHDHILLLDPNTQQTLVCFGPEHARVVPLSEPEFALDPYFAQVVWGEEVSLRAALEGFVDEAEGSVLLV